MRDELAIYFAGAVRGGGSHERLAARIEALSMFGHVLTEHMASPTTVDVGDDAAIHAHDQALLARAHVVIADVTIPSTGTGYMIARAAARELPVLCLYLHDTRPSAMIAGSPDVTTRFYADDAEWLAHVRAFLLDHAARLPATRGPRIFLAGPPGSGKGTLGRWLAEATGAPHVSTGDILRDLVASKDEHPHRAEIVRSMNAGELVPAALMRDIVVQRLGRPDCRLFGMVLDGYPPSLADLENLTANGIVPDLVLMLECSDAIAIARQVGRGARSTDTEDGARRRLAVYRASMPIADWYPNSLVARVDAEQSPDQVAAFALQTVRNALQRRRHPRSYFPIPPARPADARSTRLHFHVDARDSTEIHAFALELLRRHKPAQGQLKIYPIEALSLGAQHAALPIYRQLPNFHPIADAENEAFITGRLGDGDRALMTAVLDLGRVRHVMVELEEYVGEWTLHANGVLVADSEYTLTGDDHSYPAHASQLCSDIPAWELHHGFDLPKRGEAAPPWPLADLVAACGRAGLTNGGWFVFKNDQHWAYRSNEFSSDSFETCRDRLLAQVRTLQGLLATRGDAVDVGCSLERVHGIWLF
ncbi:MAG: nucleoside monophosphate kinase [Deltaproteobacteria bacterium]|nr:nucleoside monophosphate kinase [Deltaproteobacteria bacterium]